MAHMVVDDLSCQESPVISLSLACFNTSTHTRFALVDSVSVLYTGLKIDNKQDIFDCHFLDF